MRRVGILLAVVVAAIVLGACGASRVRPQLSASVTRNGADVRADFIASRRARLSHRHFHHGGVGMPAAQRAALIAEDPALRFVLLDVPHDPALDPSPALRAVSHQIIRLQIDGQHAVVIVPQHPNGRVVLFEHGSDQTPDFDIDDPRSARLITALVADGYGWAESNADFNNWGNAASVQADVALADWLRDRGARQIDIGGDSMGGLDATQLIPLVHPRAVFELFPVCNESSVMHLFSVDIRHADAPLNSLSPVAMQDVADLPMLITASPGDTLVLKSENADVCAAEARAGGAHVDEVTTVGEHDDPSNWEPGRIIGFLDDAAQSAARAHARARALTRSHRERHRHMHGRHGRRHTAGATRRI